MKLTNYSDINNCLIPADILQASLAEIFAKVQEQLKPPPNLSISQWAEKYRYLSPEDSDKPGPYSHDGFEYLKDFEDAFLDPNIRRMSVIKSGQTGFTNAVINIIDYLIDCDPCPIIVAYPTESNGIKFAKRKLEPNFRDTKQLRGKVSDKKNKDGSNSTLEKTFPGGFISIIGLATPNTLAQQSGKVLIIDDKSRVRLVAGEEGDTIAILEKRVTGFLDSKIISISTPTKSGECRISEDYAKSDQRRRYVPCPNCNHFQVLSFWNLKGWRLDKGVYDPDLTYYECEKCKAHIDEKDKYKMLPSGIWTRTNPKVTEHAGWHIDEMYSTLRTWRDMVISWIDKKDKPTTRQTFFNLELGLAYEDEVVHVSDNVLMARKEEYTAEKIPAGALLLVGSADVQNDRVEVAVKGFGLEEESWLVGVEKFYGEPQTLYKEDPQNIWYKVEQFLDTKFEHETGIMMRISAAGIDLGYATRYVQYFIKKMERKGKRWIFALKGDEGKVAAPLLARPTGKKKGIKQHMVGTDTAKKIIFSRLAIEEYGPGYMHFPDKIYWKMDISDDEEYFKQLTSEKQVPVYHKGIVVKRKWEKIRARNEALDLEVYALAALDYCDIKDWKGLAESFKQKVEAQEKKPEAAAAKNQNDIDLRKRRANLIKAKRRTRNFVTDY